VEVSEQQELRFELPVIQVKEEDFGPHGLPDDDDPMVGLGFDEEDDDLQAEEPLHPQEGSLPDLIPKCTGDIDCEIPSHSKQGILASEHSHPLKKYFGQILFCLMTLWMCHMGQENGAALLHCLWCGKHGLNYVDAILHIRREHGNRLLFPRTIDQVKELIKQFVRVRKEDFGQYPLTFCCRICKTHVGGTYASLVHSVIHPHLNTMPFICFFDDCCQPLFDESLEDHYRSHHVTICHKVKLATLKDHFTHQFQKHFLELSSVVPTETLQLFYSLTASKAPRIHWHAVSPIMLFPQVENPYLPAMYSIEMYHLLQSAYKTTNVFSTTLRPTNYSDELKCKLIDEWARNYLHESIHRDVSAQKEINTKLFLFWQRLVFTVCDVFQEEVSLRPADSSEVKCLSCMDSKEHQNGECVPISMAFATPDFENIRKIDFSQVAAIWVGQKNSASEFTPYSEKYQILNLTNSEDTTRVPTGYLNGQKVILKDRGTHVTKFCSLISYLTELVAFLPQSYHQPILVVMNFEQEQLLHMEVAVVSIAALVAQLDLLRKRYCVPIVLVGALPRYLSRNPQEYKSESRKVQVTNNLAAIIASKANLPFLPPQGFVYSAYDFESGSGAWSQVDAFEGFRKEPLFHPTGIPTREFRKRMGTLVDKVIDSYCTVNRKSPFYGIFLRNILFRDGSLYYRGD
jgi:hypothetical protein